MIYRFASLVIRMQIKTNDVVSWFYWNGGFSLYFSVIRPAALSARRKNEKFS